jgi:protein-L-isoaspartate(D-aspartate) O-methyltransferase
MADLSIVRRAFAEEIRAIARLRSERLVEALARVPREHFLGPWQVVAQISPGHIEYQTTEDSDPKQLYRNVLVAIDAKRSLNNGQPSGLAQWIDCLDPREGEQVVARGLWHWLLYRRPR